MRSCSSPYKPKCRRREGLTVRTSAFWATLSMCLAFALCSEAKEVHLPESEWVKLLAYVDACKKNKAHDAEERGLLLQLKGNHEETIRVLKADLALRDGVDLNREEIEKKLTAIIGEKELQLAETEREVAKEKRYSRYKSEMGIPTSI